MGRIGRVTPLFNLPRKKKNVKGDFELGKAILILVTSY